jgi:hypothetical protein
MNQSMHRFLDDFQLSVILEKNESMEIPIADVTNDGALQSHFGQILLRLVCQLWKL